MAVTKEQAKYLEDEIETSEVQLHEAEFELQQNREQIETILRDVNKRFVGQEIQRPVSLLIAAENKVNYLTVLIENYHRVLNGEF